MGTATAAAACIRGPTAGLPLEGGLPRLGFATSVEASRSDDGLRLLPLAVGAAEGARPRLAFATSVDASRSDDGLLLPLAVGAAESMAAHPAGRGPPLVALEGGLPRLGFATSVDASRSNDGLRLLPLAVGAAEGGRPRLAFATSVDASRSDDWLLLPFAVGGAELMAALPAGRAAAPLVAPAALEEDAGISACCTGGGGGANGGRWAGSCWRRADMTTCVFRNSLGEDPTRAAWFRPARPLVLGLATGLSPVRSTTK